MISVVASKPQPNPIIHYKIKLEQQDEIRIYTIKNHSSTNDIIDLINQEETKESLKLKNPCTGRKLSYIIEEKDQSEGESNNDNSSDNINQDSQV